MSDRAAHIDAGISHSLGSVAKSVCMSVGMAVGIAVGALGFLTVPVSGPPGVAIGVAGIVAGANVGAQLGSFVGDQIGYALDEYVGRVRTGWIKEGAKTVFVGGKKTARIEDAAFCPGGAMMDGAALLVASIICPPAGLIVAIGQIVDMAEGQGHANPVIAEGVLRIRAEEFNVARIGCKTTCAAIVCEGQPNVFFHGELGRLEGYDVLYEGEGMDDALWWTDWLGNIAELVAAAVAAFAAASMLNAALLGVAMMATLAKLMESITGENGFGYIDDGSFVYQALLEAAAAYRRTPGNRHVKLLAASAVLMAELTQSSGASKVAKRLVESGQEKDVRRPEIKRKRPSYR